MIGSTSGSRNIRPTANADSRLVRKTMGSVKKRRNGRRRARWRKVWKSGTGLRVWVSSTRSLRWHWIKATLRSRRREGWDSWVSSSRRDVERVMMAER